jgi:small basic protein
VNDATPLPTKDPLAIGLGSLAGGIGFGAASLTTAQILVALNQERFDVHGYLLVAGLLSGLGVGAICGWYRSYHLDNIWQRGVIAVLAAVGAILIGFLAAPLDKFFGVTGLIVWLMFNIAIGILATRWAIRGKGDEGSGMGTT